MGHDRQWAVVLGASAGTGAAICSALARSPGLNVFGVHRGNHPEGADLARDEVVDSGRQCHFRIADAGTAEGASEGAVELLRVAGPRSVKVFVHSIANASVGLLASGDDRQLKARQLQRTIEAMTHSFVYWVQEMRARDLLAPRALILGLSNPMEDQVVRGTAAIAASKAALGVYVRHLARELGAEGHRVNLLKFGAVITAALEKTIGRDRLSYFQEVVRRAVPAGRLSTVEEVARFVSLLASEDASWFNGAAIDFTGAESQGFFDSILAAETDWSAIKPNGR
jgi:NAD(P)-dependent dehydrogenase (short-subunit alcohol dehydrogenase family)